MISEVRNIFIRKAAYFEPNRLKLYYLSETHKEYNSMRPIVSAVGSPKNNLTKCLTIELQN